MITIVNRQAGEYVGRGSPLGNPFRMQSERDRDRVCDQYKEWFDRQVAANNQAVLNELRRLYRIARNGDLALRCFCAPKRCHAETIKEFLERHLG